MKEPSHRNEVEESANYREILYRRHFQGALVRSGASVIMWFFALAAFLANVIRMNHFIGTSLSVVYLILINPPTLLLLKRITYMRLYKYISLLINFLEILGYTAIIYFLGGIEATYITPIYAALITYVGVVSPRNFPFVISTLCWAAFSFVVAGEYFGLLPHQRIDLSYNPPMLTQLTYLMVVAGLLFVVSFISSFTGSILKKNRNEIREKNFELMEKTASLEEAEKGLRRAHQELEGRVEERTAELREANDQLSAEIRERKRADEALREGEKRYRSLFDNIPIGLYRTKPTGQTLDANPALVEMLGYPDRESLLAINTVDTYANSEHRLRWQSLMEGEGIIRNFEKQLNHHDGTIIWVNDNTRAIRDAEGHVMFYEGSIEDITERKRAEEKMSTLQEQLRQSQKMEAIGHLAGGIAHDFNNLLTVIKGYSQLSLKELRDEGPLKEDIQEIEKAADRASTLTSQLLAFSRQQIFEMKVLDLNTLLKDLDKMLRRIIGEDIDLVTLLNKDLGSVKTDFGQIQQVILNLAVNARDAMPSGGILTIETANVELDESYAFIHIDTTPGQYVMVSVSDTGVGMTPEVKERIFEPFFSTKEKGKGTGLGLSTVYGIVKQSSGNILVYSEPGQGTAFKIYLPRVDEPLEELKEKVVREELSCSSETILVAEDEEEVRKLAVRILDQVPTEWVNVTAFESKIRQHTS